MTLSSAKAKLYYCEEKESPLADSRSRSVSSLHANNAEPGQLISISYCNRNSSIYCNYWNHHAAVDTFYKKKKQIAVLV